jgi:hypothetical protein
MPGDDKAVVRTVGVLVLTLLAAIALRGYLPGAPPPAEPAATDTDGTGSLVAVVVMLAVSLTAIAVSLVARGRSPRPPRAAGEPPRARGGERRALPWRLLLIAAAALLTWLLLITLLMRRVSPVDGGTAPTGSTAGPDPATANQTPPEPDSDRGSDVFGLLMGTAVVLFLLSVLATIAGRRRRTVIAPMPADDAPRAAPPPVGPDLARAAELGLAEVGDRSRDPREAIIACYLAMERELEKSPGTVPQASDTPSEVLARAVARRAVHAGSATQLVDLFEEARFSPHVMTEEHRAEAVHALQVVQRALQGVA